MVRRTVDASENGVAEKPRKTKRMGMRDLSQDLQTLHNTVRDLLNSGAPGEYIIAGYHSLRAGVIDEIKDLDALPITVEKTLKAAREIVDQNQPAPTRSTIHLRLQDKAGGYETVEKIVDFADQ